MLVLVIYDIFGNKNIKRFDLFILNKKHYIIILYYV